MITILYPCCEYHQKLKSHYKGRLQAIFALLGYTPRTVHKIYDIMASEGVSKTMLSFALSEKCWCHEHPNPDLFRKFMGTILQIKNQGTMPDSVEDRIKLLENIANSVIGEQP
jgi:hypothetical protein